MRLCPTRKQRHGIEIVCEWLFRPVAEVLVVPLARARVPPPVVVLAGTAAGLAGAAAIVQGRLGAAAALVVLKTILDNADGQLARRTGRTSVLGRYLDVESDLLVNAALFASLGWSTRTWAPAVLGFVLLTLVLSANFDLELLYRRERGDDVDPRPAGSGFARVLEGIYGLVYTPLDRLVEGVVEWRLTRAKTRAQRLRYHDSWGIGVLANTGLSTQMAALGLALAVGRPELFGPWLCACAAAVVAVFARRELLLGPVTVVDPVIVPADRGMRR